MNSFTALHGQVHVEPGRTGSAAIHVREPETSAPGARSEYDARTLRTPDTQRHIARPPAGHGAAGRLMRPTPQAAGTPSSLLPDAYIGTPKGDLRSDERHPQILVDESGAKYVPIGNRYHAVRRDPANNTWRAVQLHDPAKPGIPVELTAAGWRPRAEVGLRGGSPNDPRVEAERQALECARNDIRRAIDMYIDQERDALRTIDGLDRDVQRAEDEVREARARNEDPAPFDQLVDATKGRLSVVKTTLRQVRDTLHAALSSLRDIERSLVRLPPSTSAAHEPR
jgi:hypothetical protein